MTTIYYVDLEGGAGTKDGTSFANRAGTFADLGTASAFLGNGDHEVRVKKSPTRSLGTGTVKRRGGWFRCGYDGCSLQTSNSYWTMSTTKGETVLRYDTHGLATGDVIEIVGNRWYFNNQTMSDAHGDGSQAQQSGNYIGLSGIWTVTAVDSNNFKLNEFTAPFNKAQNDSWPSGFSTSNQGKWYDCTGSTVVLNDALPVKELMPESNRKKFTAEVSGVNTYDVTCQQENWSNYTAWTVPEGSNRFYIESGVSQGKIATYECPNDLDLSDYQGISFELSIGNCNYIDFRGVSSTMHGRFSIRLCTDTAGSTSVHTIPIDTRYVSKQYSRGHVEFDTGGNMNAAIKSIAIYKEFNGNMTSGFYFMLSNLIAYKTATANKLNHMTTIGLGTSTNPNWYCIKYIKTHGDYNLIRLGTSGGYWYQCRDDYGYYGGGHSQQWEKNGTSLTTTGTVYAMQGHRVGAYHSETGGITDNNQTNMNSSGGSYHVSKFGNGTAQNPKLISGGWDATNMSTQGTTPLDMTILTNGFGSTYGGWYQFGSGGTYQTWKNFCWSIEGCYHNSASYYRFENCQMDNPYYAYFTSNYTRGFKDLRITCRGNEGSSLIHGTHNFSDVPDGAAGMKVSNWGMAGQSNWQVGQTPGFTWSQIKNEASYPINFSSDSYYNGTVVQKLITGMMGRTSNGVEVSNVQNFTIDDWESTYNNMQIQSDAEITIKDMTFVRGDQTTKHGTYPTSYNSYCISWNSPKISLLGGTSDARIQFQKSARINNFISTDTNEHNLSTGVTVLSANHNGVSGAGKYLNYYWNIQPETSIRHTASGTAWKMTKTSSSADPTYDIAKVAVAGSGTVTVKLWVYRTVTGTDTYAILRIPEDVTLGVAKSEMNSTNGGANQWYELTVTATPTSAGIMTVQLHLSDNTNSGVIYFDDMTITQT